MRNSIITILAAVAALACHEIEPTTAMWDDACVDQENLPVVLESHAVAADLADADVEIEELYNELATAEARVTGLTAEIESLKYQNGSLLASWKTAQDDIAEITQRSEMLECHLGQCIGGDFDD